MQTLCIVVTQSFSFLSVSTGSWKHVPFPCSFFLSLLQPALVLIERHFKRWKKLSASTYAMRGPHRQTNPCAVNWQSINGFLIRSILLDKQLLYGGICVSLLFVGLTYVQTILHWSHHDLIYQQQLSSHDSGYYHPTFNIFTRVNQNQQQDDLARLLIRQPFICISVVLLIFTV